MRKVWAMNLHCEGKDPFKFCFEQKIIGIGWPLHRSFTGDWEVYKILAPAEYGPESDNDHPDAFERAIKAFDSMQTNDLVWINDQDKRELYICEVMGQPQCHYGFDYAEAGIFSFRPCKYYFFGSYDALPAGITLDHVIPPCTLQRIQNSSAVQKTLDIFATVIV